MRTRLTLSLLLAAICLASVPAPSALARNVNLWPVFKYKDGVTQVLVPLFKYDNSNGDFAARPLVEIGGGQEHFAFAAIHLYFPRDGHSFYRVANLWYGHDSESGENKRHVGLFPLFWGTRDGHVSYFVLFPLFMRYDFDEIVPVLFVPLRARSDAMALFPLYGHGKFDMRGLKKANTATSNSLLSEAPATTQPVTNAASQASTSSLEWRFILWPLYFHAKDDKKDSTSIMWPLFNRTTGARESSWRFLPFCLWNRASISEHDKEGALEGSYESTFIIPLLNYNLHMKGTYTHESSFGKIQKGIPTSRESSQHQFLLLLASGRATEKTTSGDIIQDNAAFQLYPLYSYSSMQVSSHIAHSHEILLIFLDTFNSDTVSRWSGLGGFFYSNWNKKNGEGAFRVLWRLYEYSKDASGQKRMRLFFSPAFKIGNTPATQAASK
jgi:hypothetical protein